jgi:hypothetical protein
MSMLRVVCANPRCGRVLRIRLQQAGKRIRCPACRIALIAPNVSGSAAAARGDGEAEEVDEQIPMWMTCSFLAGLFLLFLVIVLAAVGFEVWYHLQAQPKQHGQMVDLLTATAWKNAAPKNAPAPKDDVPLWARPGMVWTFHPNGQLEIGRLMDEVSRYDRKPAKGFRTWSWSVNGETLKLTSRDLETPENIEFTVAQVKDKLVLTPPQDDEDDEWYLTLDKTDFTKTFPDLRVVFYAGIVAPMLVAFLLSWLLSREIFYHGCLRFAIGWPLTIFVGMALGAGAGYLLDVLNDFSHGTVAWWMLLALAQGVLGLLTGFVLSVLSVLRPT